MQNAQCTMSVERRLFYMRQAIVEKSADTAREVIIQENRRLRPMGAKGCFRFREFGRFGEVRGCSRYHGVTGEARRHGEYCGNSDSSDALLTLRFFQHKDHKVHKDN